MVTIYLQAIQMEQHLPTLHLANTAAPNYSIICASCINCMISYSVELMSSQKLSHTHEQHPHQEREVHNCMSILLFFFPNSKWDDPYRVVSAPS